MRTTVLFIAVCASLAGCNRASDNLSGDWVGESYRCAGNQVLREQVRVTEVDGAIEAVKLTGDDCVPAGQVTFRGSRDKLRCVVGTPENPASGEVPGSVKIINATTFEACSVTFVRQL